MVVGLALPAAGAVHAAHPSAGTTLKLWNDKPTWASYYNTVGQASLKATGVGFKPVAYADTTTYQAAVRTAGRTSKAPDLFTWWSGYQMVDIVNAGLAADVSALWDKNKSAYSPGLRAAFTFRGKTYGIPENLAYWEVIYNKHVFAKYNLTPPTTWAQFQAINKTLRSHGVTPLGATIDGRWPAFIYFEELLVRDRSEGLQQSDGRQDQVHGPRRGQGHELLGFHDQRGRLHRPRRREVRHFRQQQLLGALPQGKVAMVEIGSWYEPTLTGAGLKPGVDYGAFLMPDINPSVGKVVIFETGPIVVAAHGPNRDQAMKAADYFMSQGRPAGLDQCDGLHPRAQRREGREYPRPADGVAGQQWLYADPALLGGHTI